MKLVNNIIILLGGGLILSFFSCKKDKLLTDSGAKIQFSQDSVLFDTVFTSIGSTTKHFHIANPNNQKIKVSSIQLAGGSGSAFKLNVDGSPGTFFEDIEIAAHDSIYVFVQVNINPGNVNSPFIIRDSLIVSVNGNQQQVQLEAWGQDAYYHRPTDAIKFKDGSYLPFSYLNNDTNAISVTWPNDKPHVIYGYLAIYTGQKLTIDPGVKVYMNYRAGLWVYTGGEIHINGQKGNEVIFQGVRREKDFENEAGQWDRIWINEGSVNNEINYAIIKNGYIGVQAELLGNQFFAPKRLKITNTKIQNMSKWGLYGLAFNIYGGNNVISNCQEQCLNLTLGGNYTFIHCTFANFFTGDKPREVPAVSINNHAESQVLPDSVYFGNCVIDGTLSNEINLDLQASSTSSLNPQFQFSSSWLKTTSNISDANHYIDVRKGTTSLKYKDIAKYDFKPDNETANKNFQSQKAIDDANKFMYDIDGNQRDNVNVSAGAYQN